MIQLKMMLLIGISWCLLSNCSATTIGKVDVSSGHPPDFLKLGKTTPQEVLERLGEPLGYREQDNRSAMIYEYVHENFTWIVIGSIWQEHAYRLDLVFENNVLNKAEVQKEGWGFAGQVDSQLIQLLAR